MDESKEKINTRRILITIGIVLITAIVIGGTVWYIMDQNAKSIAESNKQSEEALQKQIDDLNAKVDSNVVTTGTTTTSTDPTAGWKTYESTKYGLSLKYPSDWTVNDANPPITNDVPAPNPAIIFKDATGNDFRIYAYSKDSGAGWGMEGVNVSISYKGTVSNKRITLSDRTLTESPSTDVNGGTKGYWIHTNLTYGDTDFKFNGTGSDSTNYKTGDENFNKMVGTITLK